MVIHTHLLASITKPPITHSSTVTVNSLSPTLANRLPLHFHCVLSHFHPSYLHPQIPAVETTTTKKTFGRKSKTDLHGLSICFFVVAMHYQMPLSYIFALTSMSFRDLPLL